MPPDQKLTRPDGTTTRVADLLHTGRGLLITTGPATAHTTDGLHDRVHVAAGTWTTTPEPALDAVLIRPDGYIAWTSPGSTHNLTDALDRWFGAARVPQPTR
jgi:hypothetical protein